MEVTIESALRILAELLEKGEVGTLETVSKELSEVKPDLREGWRYYGIALLLQGRGGESHLRRAALNGDAESALWLSVLSEFSCHPAGTLVPQDLLQQVALEKLRRSRYMEFPTEVHIETQAICNAKCTFCPYPTMERQGDRMSDELIDKIIDDLRQIPSNIPFTIAPFKVNDPFLDKRIFSVCEKINTQLPNAKLRLFTNGSPLTPTIVEKIAALKNVIHLWVSLNESEPEAYKSLMDLPFEKTLEKLDMLHRRVAEGYPHPVTVSRVADGTVRDQEFRDFLAQRYPLFQCFMIGRGDWAGQVDINSKKRVPPIACTRWYEVSIMASGKVALCCMDGEGKHVIGDVNNQSVLEVYNSPQYRKMRQYTFSRLAAANPCDTCVY